MRNLLFTLPHIRHFYRSVFTLVALLLSVSLTITAAPATIQSEFTSAFDVRWSPDGQWIGVVGSDGVRLFDADDLEAEPLHYFEDMMGVVLAFDPVRPQAAFASNLDFFVRVFDIETGEVLQEIAAPPYSGQDSSLFYDLQYSGDGSALAILNNTALHILDLETGEWRYPNLPSPVNDYGFFSTWFTVDFGVSTTRVIGGTFDGDIAVYNSGVLGAVLDTRLEFGALRLEALPDINGVVFNTYNALYLFRFANSEITLLLGNEMGELEQERVFGFDLHSDGTTLAAGVGSKIVLYDLESREIMNQWSLPDLESDAPTVLVFALAWHPDATQLATLRTDGTLEVWAVETGELLASWQLYNSAYSQKWG